MEHELLLQIQERDRRSRSFQLSLGIEPHSLSDIYSNFQIPSAIRILMLPCYVSTLSCHPKKVQMLHLVMKVNATLFQQAAVAYECSTDCVRH